MASESQKQLKELEKQQAQDREYAGPEVVQHGMEVQGMVRPQMSHEAKAKEMMGHLDTPAEHREFQRRRASGYGKK